MIGSATCVKFCGGGFRDNVVFPCGMILEEGGGEVKIHYGAAGTVICSVTANVEDLVRLCGE